LRVGAHIDAPHGRPAFGHRLQTVCTERIDAGFPNRSGRSVDRYCVTASDTGNRSTGRIEAPKRNPG
jgi:hypothetical protein